MPQNFFQELLCPDDNYKLLWTLKDKRSHWFQDISKLTQFALSADGDIYFGLGETDQKLSNTRRALSDQIVSLRAFHLDIDLLSKIAHKKELLPENIKIGLEIAHSIMEPTYIVDSGYGLHAYWLLYEHYKNFDTERMTAFIQQFQEAHRKKYPQYKLDATHDLTRILRCPGSKNYKDPKNPKECKIIEYNKEAYYDLTEFEDAIAVDYDKIIVDMAPAANNDGNSNDPNPVNKILVDASGKVKPLKVWTTKDFKAYATRHNIVIDKNAKFDGEKFLDIADVEDPHFLNTYNHTLPIGDSSASSYDWALVNMASNYNLTDQELINLMIQHRSKFGEKIIRKGIPYFIRTILKIRNQQEATRIQAKNNATQNSANQKKLSSTCKESIREYLYGVLNISINRIVRYPKSPNPEFHLESTDKPDATIVLGTFKEGIMSQINFATKIAGEGLPLPTMVKNKQWITDIIPKLRMLTVRGDSPQASTYEGQIKAWLLEYFDRVDVLETYQDFYDSNDRGKPFMHEDKVFFSYDKFFEWVQTNKNKKLDFAFSVTMQNLGFKITSFRDQYNSKIDLWATSEFFHVRKEDRKAQAVGAP